MDVEMPSSPPRPSGGGAPIAGEEATAPVRAFGGPGTAGSASVPGGTGS